MLIPDDKWRYLERLRYQSEGELCNQLEIETMMHFGEGICQRQCHPFYVKLFAFRLFSI